MTSGIAKDAEYVFSVDFSRFIAQVVEVNEEVKQEAFVNDVVPIFRLILRSTDGQRVPSRETTSSSCSRPYHAMYFPQRASDGSNFSVAINQGVIAWLPFYATTGVNSCEVE